MADQGTQPDEPPSLRARLRAAPVTAVIIAANVAAFLWVQQHGGTSDPGNLLRFGALEPLHVWAGEPWRLLTCMFLHGGWVHIAANMYMTAGWATALERALGAKRFTLVFLLSGLAGSCASVISGWVFGGHLSVGASGALFGVVGAVLALRRRQLGSFQAFFADKGIRSLLMQIGIWTAIGLTVLHLDNAAHFGGLITGFLVTWLFVTRASRAVWLALAAACGALFLFAARPWWTPEGLSQEKLLVMARSYLAGAEPDGEPWPLDVARGERFLTRGCAHGIARACGALADHLVTSGGADAPARSEAMRRRACELDSRLCAPQP